MIRIAAVLFLICYPVYSGYETSYSELELLRGSCYPQDSCSSPRKDDEDHLWGNYTCECGSHCTRYGTCCVDSPYSGKHAHFEYRGETCQKPAADFQEAVMLVSKCPNVIRYGPQVREKCEMVNSYVEDPLALAPVTSLATQVTYKNYFCALCNDDTRDILTWNAEFKARENIAGISDATTEEFLTKLVFDSERKAWGLKNSVGFHKLKLKFKLPSYLKKTVKKCYPDLTAQCESNCDELLYKCSSYYAPIKLKETDGRISRYRNVHCAMCNGVNISRTDKDICKLDDTVLRGPQGFSFALLLDVNRSDGDVVGKKQLCGDQEKWDPFFKKCRNLVCAIPGYVVRNGKCVQS